MWFVTKVYYKNMGFASNKLGSMSVFFNCWLNFYFCTLHIGEFVKNYSIDSTNSFVYSESTRTGT